VRWSRGRVSRKVILVPFLYIYNNCVFFFLEKSLYFLTYPRKLHTGYVCKAMETSLYCIARHMRSDVHI
jgi:hypothetical protein